MRKRLKNNRFHIPDGNAREKLCGMFLTEYGIDGQQLLAIKLHLYRRSDVCIRIQKN